MLSKIQGLLSKRSSISDTLATHPREKPVGQSGEIWIHPNHEYARKLAMGVLLC